MRLGAYELEGEIGRGGAGTVFRGRARDGSVVAIKVLTRTGSSPARDRFERERRLLASLGPDDGFVPLVDAGEERGRPYIVMPFVDGGTLRDRLGRGPLAIGDTVALGETLARALARAHEAGIVHRDMKPENVLFERSGRALIADLGLAKHFAADAPGATSSVALTRTGELSGTAGYMAPEQARDAKSAGPPADVFALGAILYECLAGWAAFEGRSLLEVLTKVESESPSPIANVRPETPTWLASVVERALARDPAARFADGSALLEALRARAVVGRAGESRRSSRILIIVGAMLVVALAGATLALLSGSRRDASPAPAETSGSRPDSRITRLLEQVASILSRSVADRNAWVTVDELKRLQTALEPSTGAADRERVAAVVERLHEKAARDGNETRFDQLSTTLPLAASSAARARVAKAWLDVAHERARSRPDPAVVGKFRDKMNDRRATETYISPTILDGAPALAALARARATDGDVPFFPGALDGFFTRAIEVSVLAPTVVEPWRKVFKELPDHPLLGYLEARATISQLSTRERDLEMAKLVARTRALEALGTPTDVSTGDPTTFQVAYEKVAREHPTAPAVLAAEVTLRESDEAGKAALCERLRDALGWNERCLAKLPAAGDPTASEVAETIVFEILYPVVRHDVEIDQDSGRILTQLDTAGRLVRRERADAHAFVAALADEVRARATMLRVAIPSADAWTLPAPMTRSVAEHMKHASNEWARATAEDGPR